MIYGYALQELLCGGEARNLEIPKPIVYGPIPSVALLTFWLVEKTRLIFYPTNQMLNKNQVRRGIPRFPAL